MIVESSHTYSIILPRSCQGCGMQPEVNYVVQVLIITLYMFTKLKDLLSLLRNTQCVLGNIHLTGIKRFF